MKTVEEIEAAVLQLSAEDRAILLAWMASLDASQWDRQVEQDVEAGRLNWLADEARADRQARRCTDL